MTSNVKNFVDCVDDILPMVNARNDRFEGYIIDLDDDLKDFLCLCWLKTMKSWHCDIMPPIISDSDGFIDMVYSDLVSPNEAIKNYRTDIYLYLENTMGEIFTERWNIYANVEPEEFPGYEIGQ